MGGKNGKMALQEKIIPIHLEEAEDYHYALCCSMASNREDRFLKRLGDKKESHLIRELTLEYFGWEPLKTSKEFNIGKEQGYFGVAYYKLSKKTKSCEFIIAHRGTCFDEVGNILADIAIAERKKPIILEEAIKYVTSLFEGRNFYDGSIPYTKTFKFGDFKITKITHTGFSLGGFIAGACASLTQYPITKAVTFDAPGIAALDGIDKDRVKNRIINYVTRPNLVNTAGLHIGEIRELAFMDVKQAAEVKFTLELNNLGFSVPKKLPEQHSIDDLRAYFLENEENSKKREYVIKSMEEFQDTLESHDLDKIIHIIEQEIQYKLVISWPSATNDMIYGSKPEFPKDVTHFGINDFGSLLFSSISVGGLLAKHTVREKLWEITKKLESNNTMAGIIGISHLRRNDVQYHNTKEMEGETTNMFVLYSGSKKTQKKPDNDNPKLRAVKMHVINFK